MEGPKFHKLSTQTIQDKYAWLNTGGTIRPPGLLRNETELHPISLTPPFGQVYTLHDPEKDKVITNHGSISKPPYHSEFRAQFNFKFNTLVTKTEPARDHPETAAIIIFPVA